MLFKSISALDRNNIFQYVAKLLSSLVWTKIYLILTSQFDEMIFNKSYPGVCFRDSVYILHHIVALRIWNPPAEQQCRFKQTLEMGFWVKNLYFKTLIWSILFHPAQIMFKFFVTLFEILSMQCNIEYWCNVVILSFIRSWDIWPKWKLFLTNLNVSSFFQRFWFHFFGQKFQKMWVYG